MQFSGLQGAVIATAFLSVLGLGSASAADSSASRGSARHADIPLVPLEDEATSQAPAAAHTATPPAANEALPSLANPGKYDRREIKVESGVNTIVRVAQGHLNRIVTPFRHPQVRTTASNANTQVSSSVVYVAPSSTAPVTLYVTEKNDESTAISLTLVPRRVPPRSFSVDVTGGPAPAASAKAQHWERASDYQQSITNVLRTVAKGKIPPGYSMADRPKADPPYCYQKGVTFDFRQTLAGHDFWVAVGTITNRSGHRIEFSENSCLYERRVAAVAAWPRVILGPGKQSEVYAVVRPVAETIERQPERPSLLNTRAQAQPPARAGLPGTWRVLLPPITSERVAREKVAALRAKGFAAGTYSQGNHYIVRVSGYKSRETANQARATLKDMGYENMAVMGGAQ